MKTSLSHTRMLQWARLWMICGIVFAATAKAFTNSCNSFGSRCNVEIGKVFSDNNLPVQLQDQTAYYLSITVSCFGLFYFLISSLHLNLNPCIPNSHLQIP